MSRCRVIVKKKGQFAFVRKAGNLSIPEVEVSGKLSNITVLEALRESLGATQTLMLASDSEMSAVLVEVDASDECNIPSSKDNAPIWVDAVTVTDQAIGMIAKQVPIGVDDMDLVRKNFTVLSS